MTGVLGVTLLICLLAGVFYLLRDELDALIAVGIAVVVVTLQHRRTMAKLHAASEDSSDTSALPSAYVIDATATGFGWWRERLIWLVRTAWRNASS